MEDIIVLFADVYANIGTNQIEELLYTTRGNYRESFSSSICCRLSKLKKLISVYNQDTGVQTMRQTRPKGHQSVGNIAATSRMCTQMFLNVHCCELIKKE
ncbi:hypothetical protein PHET_06784 [Paragonimus heterotremus]|uniref:Uncharacterized protein n=1 Tax=Paragonimus heterotremus TaxID=100268 RepID=A0A8J4TDW9_9TREM|nr:hypothetical protein PHET_06784 [Paragonimus heterotremus]